MVYREKLSVFIYLVEVFGICLVLATDRTLISVCKCLEVINDTKHWSE